VVGHGHAIGGVARPWIGLAASEGALLKLDTATLSELGLRHGLRVVQPWKHTARKGRVTGVDGLGGEVV